MAKGELENIYRTYRQAFFSLALTVTRNATAAEDAVHEAFTRLLKSEKPDNVDLKAYAFQSVRNAAIDQVRRISTRNHYESETIFTQRETAPLESATRSELADTLGKALEELPGPQREVVVMKIYGQLTFDQIAEALGEPLPTVASRYRRALQALQEKVAHLAQQ